MANKNLFTSFTSRLAKKAANTVNHEGAPAYALSKKGALAQLAATGCLSHTFYAKAEEQLELVLNLCLDVDAAFVAKTAVYARERGHMKDMPALLLAHLAAWDGELFDVTFDRVIDNARMLRTFVQILRSGVTGRRSLGSLPKRKIRAWLEQRDLERLFKDAVGNDPSLADVIKMVHPRPSSKEREALYGYLLGKAHDASLLPPLVRDYEAFKRDLSRPVPDVPFQLLTALDLEPRHWKAIAERAPWTMTRMNLNTFARHGVLDDRRMVKRIAERLADAHEVKKARAFPYQLLAAWVMAEVPAEISSALEAAMEQAIGNVPALDGRVVVAPDVSGSMSSPVTGYRRGSTSAVRYIDVAALVAAAVVRKNRDARVLPFEHKVVDVQLGRHAKVMANAAKLASIGGGGTACSAPLERLNRERAHVDLVWLVSDNESWADTARDRRSATLREWDELKKRCPRAKLVCLDIAPYTTVQAPEREDVLHVGGFSDAVFDVVASFARGELGRDRWVSVIEKVDLGRSERAA